MSRSIGIAHIVREPNGAATGIWGPFAIKSAFQPIFTFRGGRLAMRAFEGLARPFRDGQPVSPGQFFKLLPADDGLHVDTLLRTLHLLNAGTFLPLDATIFINFDPSVLTSPQVVEAMLRDVRLVLHEAGIDPGRVVCEITEQRISSTDSFLAFLTAMRSLGVRIAIDDFGADDSDIERVRGVRPDIVKFDAKWINRLMETGSGFALLSAVMGEFSRQGIVTVLEGIEEGWQLEAAERAGASMVQGFAIRRPELVPTSFARSDAAPASPAPAPQPPQILPPQAAKPALRSRTAFGRKGV